MKDKLTEALNELAFQLEEKEKRANELSIANKELAFQLEEKEKRAAELVLANKELAFQNKEKEKKALDLIIANKELVFQNIEKEKRAAELIEINKELESFNYISSHDLQEPLRHIQSFASRIISDEQDNLSEKGKLYFDKINKAANRMQILLSDLLVYSRTTTEERKFEKTDLTLLINSIRKELKESMDEKQAIIEASDLGSANIVLFQFRQLLYNLIGNSLKFSKPNTPPEIKVSSRVIIGEKIENVQLLPEVKYCHITIQDNGIGFEPQYKDRIFELFQRLHDKQKIAGTGIGLSIVKKIVENHKGFITADSQLDLGAKFDIYIPLN